MNIDEINLTLTMETRLPKYQHLADLLGNWIADNHPAGGTHLPSELSHTMILPLYDLCRKLNLRIPEDLSIIAFDDPLYAVQLTPPMTFFAQPVEDFTRMAAMQLERLIHHKEPLEVTPSDAILVERGSCRSLLSEKQSNKTRKGTAL